MLRRSTPNQSRSATLIASVGMLGLASAMGIGRFSLTPLLPVMQGESGLTLIQGSWLATANYVGYLAGAIICMFASPRAERAMGYGLLCVALSTIPMGLTNNVTTWLLFRFIGGAASAFVLVGVSAWVIPQLSLARKEKWSGFVFAGVGLGIAIAGLLVLTGSAFQLKGETMWLALACIATTIALVVWAEMPSSQDPAEPRHSNKSPNAPISRDAIVAAACYSAFGYAYIIPATYLPTLAHTYIPDPLMFGWIWPLFGFAAAISTIGISLLSQSVPPRRIWTSMQWVLAVGVLAPVLNVSGPTLLLSAACAGGSFMVITMAGIREAYRLGRGRETSAIAMMTASFGIGQIAGPLAVAFSGGSSGSLVVPSVAAAISLAVSNIVLYALDRSKPRTQIP